MVAPPPLQRIPLGDAVDRYLDTMRAQVTVGGLAESTLTNYEADLKDFIALIGENTVVDDISGEDIDAAVVKYGDSPDRRYKDPDKKGAPGRGPSTQKRFRQTLSKFFARGAVNGWVQADPMQWSTISPTARGGLRTARTSLSGEQALALLQHGPGDPDAKDARPHERNYDRDRFLLSLLTVVGPRVSEVCRADLDDITTVDGQAVWRIVGKGGKERKVPLSPWLTERMDAYQANRPEPGQRLSPKSQKDAAKALVLTGRGARITSRDIQRLLERAEKRVAAQAPDLARAATPHALRHTAATLMLAAGWDVKVVAQMLGHASIATTGMYLDELPGELAAAVAAHPLSQ